MSVTKYLRYQHGVTQVNSSVTLHLRNSKKQRLIFNTFYITNAPFVNNQTAKFQLNLLKQTIATTAFVRSLQNTSVSALCG